MLRQAVDIYTAALGEESIFTADAQIWLGVCLTGRGQYEQAEALMLASLNVLRTAGNESVTQRSLQAVINLYEAWNKPEQAEMYSSELSSAVYAEE